MPTAGMEALRGHRERKQRVLSPAGGQNTHRGPGSGQALREHSERKQRFLSRAGAEHSQGDGQRSGPAGPPGKPGAGWGCGAGGGAGPGGGEPTQETHQVYRVHFVVLRQGARHEGLPALPLLLRQLCQKGRCNVRTEAPGGPPPPPPPPPPPFRSCCSCSALGPFSKFCTRALATLVKWPM